HVRVRLTKQCDVVGATMARNIHRHLHVAKLRSRPNRRKHRRSGETNAVLERHALRRAERCAADFQQHLRWECGEVRHDWTTTRIGKRKRWRKRGELSRG